MGTMSCIPSLEATYVWAAESQQGERFRKGRDSQGLFKKFLISLIVRDNMQQFAGSCDDYQYQQFNRCWYAVPWVEEPNLTQQSSSYTHKHTHAHTEYYFC